MKVRESVKKMKDLSVTSNKNETNEDEKAKKRVERDYARARRKQRIPTPTILGREDDLRFLWVRRRRQRDAGQSHRDEVERDVSKVLSGWKRRWNDSSDCVWE